MDKEEQPIRTSKQIEEVRKSYEMYLRRVSAYHIPAIAIILIIAIAMPFEIPGVNLPMSIRPFWNTYGLLFGIGIIYAVIFRFLPIGKNYEKQVRLIRAIKTYDRAVSQYELWKKTNKLQALLISYECVQTSYIHLKEVPEYASLRSEVEREYLLHFGENK